MAKDRDTITASPAANGSDDALWAEVKRLAESTPGGRQGALKLLAKQGMGQAPPPVVMADVETVMLALERMLPRVLAAMGKWAPPDGAQNQPNRQTVTRTRSGANPL